MERKTVAILLSLILMIIPSCTVQQSFSSGKGSSGSSKSDITVDPFFLSVLEDFSDFREKSDYSAMDEAMAGFADTLSGAGSSSSVTLLTDGKSTRYVLSFDYTSLTSLLEELNGGKGNTILRVTENSMTFSLDMSNYAELESVIPFLSDRNFEVYGPRYSNGMTKGEYKEMISFLLGEDGPDAIDRSFVSITVNTPGDITRTEGAMKTGQRSAVFSFPVIDFLLLNEKISFRVEWKN